MSRLPWLIPQLVPIGSLRFAVRPQIRSPSTQEPAATGRPATSFRGQACLLANHTWLPLPSTVAQLPGTSRSRPLLVSSTYLGTIPFMVRAPITIWERLLRNDPYDPSVAIHAM